MTYWPLCQAVIAKICRDSRGANSMYPPSRPTHLYLNSLVGGAPVSARLPSVSIARPRRLPRVTARAWLLFYVWNLETNRASRCLYVVFGTPPALASLGHGPFRLPPVLK